MLEKGFRGRPGVQESRSPEARSPGVRRPGGQESGGPESRSPGILTPPGRPGVQESGGPESRSGTVETKCIFWGSENHVFRVCEFLAPYRKPTKWFQKKRVFLNFGNLQKIGIRTCVFKCLCFPTWAREFPRNVDFRHVGKCTGPCRER